MGRIFKKSVGGRKKIEIKVSNFYFSFWFTGENLKKMSGVRIKKCIKILMKVFVTATGMSTFTVQLDPITQPRFTIIVFTPHVPMFFGPNRHNFGGIELKFCILS